MKKKSNNQIIDEVVKATIRAIFATIGKNGSTEKKRELYRRSRFRMVQR